MAGTQKFVISASEKAMLLELASCNKAPRPIRGPNFKKWTYTGSDSNSSSLAHLKFAEHEPERSPTKMAGKRELGHSESSERSMRHLDFLKELERTAIPNKKSFPTEPPGFESPKSRATVDLVGPSAHSTVTNNIVPPVVPPKIQRTRIMRTRSQSQPQWSTVPKMARSGLKRKPFGPTKRPAVVVEDDERVWCQLCKVVCSSGYNMQQHLRGRAHKAKVEWKTKGNNRYACDVCRIMCSDREGLEMHLKGKKHKGKVLEDADSKKKKMVRCHVCEVQCMNEDSLRQHLNGRQHAIKQRKI